MATRTFIALPIAAEDQAVLDLARQALPDVSVGIRWIPPRNRHLTLRFLGSLDDSLLADVQSALQACLLPVEPLAVTIRRVGGFPRSRPGVVAIELAQHAGLRALADRVTAALNTCGIEPEARPFRGHVTIGRFRGRRPRQFPAVPSGGVLAFDRIGLYASELRPEGAQYRALRLRRFAPPSG